MSLLLRCCGVVRYSSFTVVVYVVYPIMFARTFYEKELVRNNIKTHRSHKYLGVRRLPVVRMSLLPPPSQHWGDSRVHGRGRTTTMHDLITPLPWLCRTPKTDPTTAPPASTTCGDSAAGCRTMPKSMFCSVTFFYHLQKYAEIYVFAVMFSLIWSCAAI